MDSVGGSRISFIFNDIFLATLSKADPCAGLTTQEIRTALRNSAGARDVLFVPESAFELLIKRQISRLLDPSMQCMQRVADELTNIALRAEPKVWKYLLNKRADNCFLFHRSSNDSPSSDST